MSSHGPDPLADTLLTLLNEFSITGTEGPLGERIEQRVQEQLSKSTVSYRISRHKQSLVVFIDPKDVSISERILVLGHTDTVPGEKLQARIDGDRIVGLGASDMKSGLAVMLELLRPEIASRFTRPTAFVFYAGEEGPSEGNELGDLMRAYPELLKAKLGIFAEPTDRTIQVGGLGLMNVKVTFQGKAAHSARPWNGVNAIHKAGEFLAKLDKLEPRRVRSGNVEYVEVTSATIAKGGTATNVVPASFELNLNVRVAPGCDPAKRLNELRELAGPHAEFTVFDQAPAGRVPIGNELYEEFKRVVGVPEAPKQAYTDVGLLSELGVDAINFGPGLTNQCHVAGEYVLLSDVRWCYEHFTRFLTE